MKKLLVVGMALLLSGCANKNISAHSTILGWDIPQSITAETESTANTLREMARLYDTECGATESFELIKDSNFAEEFEKMLDQKGYKKTAGPAQDDSSIFLLTGPKPVLAYVSPQRFAVCEL